MSEQGMGEERGASGEGLMHYLWERKVWWLLPLGVLLLLLGIIYALGHLSSADSEMYPTTTRQCESAQRAC